MIETRLTHLAVLPELLRLKLNYVWMLKKKLLCLSISAVMISASTICSGFLMSACMTAVLSTTCVPSLCGTNM